MRHHGGVTIAVGGCRRLWVTATAIALVVPAFAQGAAAGEVASKGAGAAREATTRLRGTITTVAGNGSADPSCIDGPSTGDGGSALHAGLGCVFEIAVGPDGAVYLADPIEHRIRRISPTGMITTLLQGPDLHLPAERSQTSDVLGPLGVAVDDHGALLIADGTKNIVLRSRATGRPVVVAGNGIAGFDGEHVPATSAQLSYPRAVAVDEKTGVIFIGDAARLRAVTPDGTMTTVTEGAFATPVGTRKARLGISPTRIAVAPDGALYFLNAGDDRLFRISPKGSVVHAIAKHCAFGDVAVGPTGKVFVSAQPVLRGSQRCEPNRVYLVEPSGKLRPVAGSGSIGFSGDGGPAAHAALNIPTALAFTPDGALLILDSGNGRIRRVDFHT